MNSTTPIHISAAESSQETSSLSNDVPIEQRPHVKYFFKNAAKAAALWVLVAAAITAIMFTLMWYETTPDQIVTLPVNTFVFALLVIGSLMIGFAGVFRHYKDWQGTTYRVTEFIISKAVNSSRMMAIRGSEDKLATRSIYTYRVAKPTFAELYIFRGCRTVTIITDTKDGQDSDIDDEQNVGVMILRDVADVDTLTKCLDKLIIHYTNQK